MPRVAGSSVTAGAGNCTLFHASPNVGTAGTAGSGGCSVASPFGNATHSKRSSTIAPVASRPTRWYWNPNTGRPRGPGNRAQPVERARLRQLSDPPTKTRDTRSTAAPDPSDPEVHPRRFTTTPTMTCRRRLRAAIRRRSASIALEVMRKKPRGRASDAIRSSHRLDGRFAARYQRSLGSRTTSIDVCRGPGERTWLVTRRRCDDYLVERECLRRLLPRTRSGCAENRVLARSAELLRFRVCCCRAGRCSPRRNRSYNFVPLATIVGEVSGSGRCAAGQLPYVPNDFKIAT